MKILSFLTICLILSLSCNQEGTSNLQEVQSRSYVVLVSFDGFSHEYLDLYDTPNFDTFISEGVVADKMIPSFPSKTFPNHYTLVTGLYPGNHGLVDNSFYDPDKDEIYRISNRDRVEDPDYYGGLPLWQLVQQHGYKSASYFWVGSEAPVAGSYPDHYYKYDGSVPNEARVEQVLEWLGMPVEDRPVFISIYFSFTDDTGHNYGPYSSEMSAAVKEADRLLGLLVSGLDDLPLEPTVIVVSDHGMYPMTSNQETYLFFDELVDLKNDAFLAINNGTHGHIYAMDADKEKLDSLQSYLQSMAVGKGFGVYRKGSYPEAWKYENKRSGDILLVAEPGKYFAMSTRNTGDSDDTWGTHGFDPYNCDELGSVFCARGPNIIPNSKVDTFPNVNVYPFIARILGLKVGDIDGEIGVLETIYRQ